MATTTYPHAPNLRSRMSGALGAYFTRYIETHARTARIERLQAKSDAELARIGLRRDDIVRHVFRDRLAM